MFKSSIAGSSFPFAAAVFAVFTLSGPAALGQTVIAEYPHPAPMQVTETHDGFTARNGREMLQVTVCSDSVVHVVARPAGASDSPSPRPWMLDQAWSCPGAAFRFSQA